MELTGIVEVVLPVEKIGAKGTPKQIVVLKVEDGHYPQSIPIEFFGKAVSKIGDLAAGQAVTISIDVRGRRWTSPQGEVKYFSSISGWRIQSTSAGGNDYPTEGGGGGGGTGGFPGNSDDDIPFACL